MKKAGWLLTLLGGLGLAWGTLGILSAEANQDILTLKDGRVVAGQIVDENDDSVALVSDGVKRSYSRDFISKISYGSATDNAVGTSGLSPAVAIPRQSGDALTADLAARFQVPEHSVIWVRRQGIPDSDLAEVLQVAADAQVQLRTVVRLRLQGWSWRDIRAHFGLHDRPVVVAEPAPATVHVVVPIVPVILPPPLFLRVLLWPFFLLRHVR